MKVESQLAHSLLAGVLLVAMTAAVGGHAQQHDLVVTQQRRRARALELIKQARAAVGPLDGVQTLSASGKYSRTVKYISVQSPIKVTEKLKQLGGKISIDFDLPDKFRKRMTEETLRGFGFSYAQVVTSEDAWRDPPLRAVSSGRDSRVVDVTDFQRTELMSAQGARQQLTFYALGWLVQPSPAFPLTLDYDGVYQLPSSPESQGQAMRDQAKPDQAKPNQAKPVQAKPVQAKPVQAKYEQVDVIVVEGKGGFRAAWLFDVTTHLPVGIAVGSFEARSLPVISEAYGFFDRRFMQETFARVRRERQARAQPATHHEVLFRFSDRRTISGISLPRRITTLIDGEVFEEAVFDDFEINHPINPKKFKGPPKSKDDER